MGKKRKRLALREVKKASDVCTLLVPGKTHDRVPFGGIRRFVQILCSYIAVYAQSLVACANLSRQVPYSILPFLLPFK